MNKRSRRRFWHPAVELLETRSMLAITWPLPASHDMGFSFGGGSPASFYDFHEGIDIRADGHGGQSVVAARSGVVYWNNPGYAGGMVTIEVDVGGGTKEYDGYLHVANIVAPPGREAVAGGTPIAMGDPIGEVSTTLHNDGSRHLHFDVYDSPPPFDSIANQNQYLNPLLRFDQAADKDPLGNKPELRDTNNDNKKVLVTVGNNNPLVLHLTPVINSDVDIIIDAVDPMSSDLGFMTNPYRVGYWVEPRFWLAHGVKSAGAPYLLAKFDDTWFDGWQDGIVHHNSSEKFGDVYDTHSNADKGTFPWDVLDHYIVTNTKGVDGKIENVDNGQYWNTNAKNDLSENTVAHANFAGKADAAKNWEARFFDADYMIHAILGDVVNTNEDINGRLIRVNNFLQKAGTGVLGIPPSGGVPLPLRKSGTQFLPDDFEPEVATFEGSYLYGETIGVEGDEYLGNFAMTAYILPHRTNGWLEGDSLTGAVASVVVQSDAEGVVPLTQAWEADQLDAFDIIIDYDNDGKFSSTLDGLSAFSVYYYEPVANDDDYTTFGGQAFNGNVLDNDEHAQLARLVPSSGPFHGSFTFNSNGSFTYDPDYGYDGFDTFEYIAINTTTGEESAPGLVTIHSVQYFPVVEDDEFSGPIDAGLGGNVRDNDGLMAMTIVLDTDASHGTLVLNSDGTFSYDPDPGWSGIDAFSYRGVNEAGESDPAIVSIFIYDYEPLTLNRLAIESNAASIQTAQLAPMGDEALRRWRNAGVDKRTLQALLGNLQFVIADLPGSHLAGATPDGKILIDLNAAGHGWFVDSTLGDDVEFPRWTSSSEAHAAPGSEAGDHADLLTAVMHEMGHLLGLDHDSDASELMAPDLGLGTRRLPTTADADLVDLLFYQSQEKRRRR